MNLSRPIHLHHVTIPQSTIRFIPAGYTGPLEIPNVCLLTVQADKRFFALLKKHFDSAPVEDDKPGEKERYNREGVTLSRLTRRK